jgi:hypothetical protein
MTSPVNDHNTFGAVVNTEVHALSGKVLAFETAVDQIKKILYACLRCFSNAKVSTRSLFSASAAFGSCGVVDNSIKWVENEDLMSKIWKVTNCITLDVYHTLH